MINEKTKEELQKQVLLEIEELMMIIEKGQYSKTELAEMPSILRGF